MEIAFNRKAHWQKIFTEKDTQQVSWYQATPQHSLDWIAKVKPPKNAHILDVGAGDSRLPDALLAQGYSNISALDISAAAINKAQERMGPEAEKVNWINDDILDLKGIEAVDLWHDRAAFHFLKNHQEVAAYMAKAAQYIVPNGNLIVATFSVDGPKKCSGLEIEQYSEGSLEATFSPAFKVMEMKRVKHETPSAAMQEFLFAWFKLKD